MDLPVLILVYSVLFFMFVSIVFLKTRMQALVHLVAFITFSYIAEVVPTFLEVYHSDSLEVFGELAATLAELCITVILVPFLYRWIYKKTGVKRRLIAGKTSRGKDLSGILVALALFIAGVAISVVLPMPDGMIELPMSLALFITVLVHFLVTKDMFLKYTDLNIMKMVLYPFIATNLPNSFPFIILTMILVNVTFIVVFMAGFNQHDSLQVARWEVEP